MTTTAKATHTFLVFTEGDYSRQLDTEQECKDFAREADERTGGNVRVTWVDSRVAQAAPELLEAARPFANYACEEPDDCHNCRARAAIAKATGEPA